MEIYLCHYIRNYGDKKDDLLMKLVYHILMHDLYPSCTYCRCQCYRLHAALFSCPGLSFLQPDWSSTENTSHNHTHVSTPSWEENKTAYPLLVPLS